MSTRSEALSAALDKMGLGSDAALVLHFPLRYEDETRITPVALARAGQPVQVEVEVTQAEVKFRPRRQLVVTAADDSGTATDDTGTSDGGTGDDGHGLDHGGDEDKGGCGCSSRSQPADGLAGALLLLGLALRRRR